jgi:hypothetical protein
LVNVIRELETSLTARDRQLIRSRCFRARQSNHEGAGGADWQGMSGTEHTSAANLKFLPALRQVHHRNFKFEAALEINKLLELL